MGNEMVHPYDAGRCRGGEPSPHQMKIGISVSHSGSHVLKCNQYGKLTIVNKRLVAT